MLKIFSCPCGTNTDFALCCQPYITGKALPPTPEKLMRARYSAYATGDFQYIANTYATHEQSAGLLENSSNKTVVPSATELKNASEGTQWCKLEIVCSHYDNDLSDNSFSDNNFGEVEFVAYYKLNKQFYAMHERSRFTNVQNKWLYVDGQMLSKTGSIKLGRNDSCLCGSGKKYKRCCDT